MSTVKFEFICKPEFKTEKASMKEQKSEIDKYLSSKPTIYVCV